ncbi:tetrahydromethanopterin S-methyltransferase subunit G [Ancylobacter sp. 3268]|uniref:hypothetical protein n=1 Tax=Ancylobacter sp. 3268 TaxID=2817752 RepID=UPI00285A8168|nr:hypothetical protein [Ancylobacter sp. 3268]MDR6952662.1 tetrahydromethanopterin S-methyltransferase subunit G [Ancylobacter sp. 3268]
MSDEINRLHERLARIETTQGHQNDLLEKIDKKLDRQDERLGAIEKTSATYGTVAGAVVSAGIALISAKLTGKA